jgi:trehalose/maltose hydrolase-like predicted phosphorylase
MTPPETMDQALRPTDDAEWVIVENGYDPLRESVLESRFAISNGFLGVRGARATTRGARWIVPARTYVAGLFDTTGAPGAVSGLAPAADWLNVRILVDGRPLVQHPGDVASHVITLDLKRGALLTEWRPPHGRGLGVRLRTSRLVSLSERAIGMQLIQLKMEEGDAEITLEATFEGADIGLASIELEQDAGVWRTQHSGLELAMASAAALWVDGADRAPTTLGQFKWSWTWKSHPGQLVDFERLVAVTRSAAESPHPAVVARKALAASHHPGWRGVLAEHEAAWAGRWRSSDVRVDGDAEAQRALRFALYHLNSAANPDDDQVSIGARALTGDDYLGHVFWDTEIYLLPFYTLTWPEAARAMLMYRFHTLDGARAKAVRLGWRGALYAWESARTGAETSPEQVIGPDRKVIDVLCGRQEQHISADVVFAVWQYWEATRDEGFLLDAGAEILFETARFWASRGQLESDGLRHIRGVIGPDEYHEHIDDNAFTNVMARWNIRRGLEVAALLQDRWPARWEALSRGLQLDDAELDQWRDAAGTLKTGLDPKTGLYEEFAGYFDLEDIDLSAYAGRSVPMDVVLGRERTQASQVVKQADVVALLALLPDEFAGQTGAANFRYYEPRCGQGSSLSRAMHGLVAARLGDGEMAAEYFRQTAAIDLSDVHVATAGGVHIAALGGLWMMTVLGFAGLALQCEGIALNPQLPPGWDRLEFPLQWRGRHLRISIDAVNQRLEATLESGKAMKIFFDGTSIRLEPNRVLSVPLRTPASAAQSLLGGSAGNRVACSRDDTASSGAIAR